MRIGQKVCHTDLTAAWQPTCTPAYIAAPVVHSQREQGGDTSPADAAGRPCWRTACCRTPRERRQAQPSALFSPVQPDQDCA